MKKEGMILVLLLLAASLVCNYMQYRRPQKKPEIRTDTIVEYREYKDVKPLQVDSQKKPPVVRKLAVAGKKFPTAGKQIDTLYIKDSVEVEVPMTQKVFADSTYTAWVSGYEPRLDSIRIRQKIQTIRLKEKNRKLHFGVTCGYGLGVSSKKFEPFIGIGITWNLW